LCAGLPHLETKRIPQSDQTSRGADVFRQSVALREKKIDRSPGGRTRRSDRFMSPIPARLVFGFDRYFRRNAEESFSLKRPRQ
jgi:hypothetical protein